MRSLPLAISWWIDQALCPHAPWNIPAGLKYCLGTGLSTFQSQGLLCYSSVKLWCCIDLGNKVLLNYLMAMVIYAWNDRVVVKGFKCV